MASAIHPVIRVNRQVMRKTRPEDAWGHIKDSSSSDLVQKIERIYTESNVRIDAIVQPTVFRSGPTWSSREKSVLFSSNGWKNPLFGHCSEIWWVVFSCTTIIMVEGEMRAATALTQSSGLFCWNRDLARDLFHELGR
ncbi:hypothetical protein OPV22_006850 [Ensete ventricosum]|uniref:Uncharacterized protein n=1 Tax=Ensete ventricosum TaxID=4639 RepID=A0AAV8RQI5_ENSVE|nr:hypothetical protein OPV22_006850 [Ensete ventricosum]